MGDFKLSQLSQIIQVLVGQPHTQVLVILDSPHRGPFDAERGVGGLLVGFSEVQQQLFCLADIEGEIIHQRERFST